MDLKEIKQMDSEYIAPTYNRFSMAIERGEGATIVDVSGKKYIDFTSGIGVNIFGMNDETWKNAVIEQLNKAQHSCNLYYTQPQIRLAELLCEKSGAKKVFFGNSGAEANECAIKAARKYAAKKYGDGKKYEIVTLENSFHGRTLATLAATGQEAFHKYFGPFPEGFVYAKPTFENVKKAITDKTCAVMMELIQGESGVHVLDKNFVRQTIEYCRERDILFIVDEVQSGNGRTGYMYSYQAYDIMPDIVTTAKGLGGGLPIGACLLFGEAAEAFSAGDHGSTFGGNPVVCAGAVTVVERLTKELFLEVQAKGEYLKTFISKMKGVEEVTGMGLMLGIKVRSSKTVRAIAEECLANGLMVLTAHDRLRLLPPLNITKTEMNEGLKILNEVLEK
jgi:acetylornithine/N-succinyldiaminopimelate aminotransferase